MLFITNNIADALSDLSWTTVLACAEPCVENRTIRFFYAKRSIPTFEESQEMIDWVSVEERDWSAESQVLSPAEQKPSLHLKSHQRCSAGIRTWLSADQSSSSTLTQSIISLWPLPYTQRHCHVRIKKAVQTVAIKLEAHNSLEYHYMLNINICTRGNY